MRKGAVAVVAVALIAIVLGFTMFARPEAKTGRPTLRVTGTSPLKVRGDHFRSGERVRLTAAAATVRTKANGDGFFVVTIRGATRCDLVRVLARGSAGSYVVVKILPPPACMPARSR